MTPSRTRLGPCRLRSLVVEQARRRPPQVETWKWISVANTAMATRTPATALLRSDGLGSHGRLLRQSGWMRRRGTDGLAVVIEIPSVVWPASQATSFAVPIRQLRPSLVTFTKPIQADVTVE
jgi:hypothetical protein